MKIYVTEGKQEGGGEWSIKFRTDGWQKGYKAAMQVRKNPPPGYRLVMMSMRKDTSGRRVELRMVIRHIDSRKPELPKHTIQDRMVWPYLAGQDQRGEDGTTQTV